MRSPIPSLSSKSKVNPRRRPAREVLVKSRTRPVRRSTPLRLPRKMLPEKLRLLNSRRSTKRRSLMLKLPVRPPQLLSFAPTVKMTLVLTLSAQVSVSVPWVRSLESQDVLAITVSPEELANSLLKRRKSKSLPRRTLSPR